MRPLLPNHRASTAPSLPERPTTTGAGNRRREKRKGVTIVKSFTATTIVLFSTLLILFKLPANSYILPPCNIVCPSTYSIEPCSCPLGTPRARQDTTCNNYQSFCPDWAVFSYQSIFDLQIAIPTDLISCQEPRRGFIEFAHEPPGEGQVDHIKDRPDLDTSTNEEK
jgi:hypothetical protein